MGKSSPPPPPDPGIVAAAQGGENRDTAAFNSAINRVNQVGPNGSTTWTIRPGADPKNPQPGDYIQTTSYSPQQQALYDAQSRIGQNLAGVAESGLNRVGAGMATPFSTEGLAQYGELRGVSDTSRLPQLAGGGSYADQTKAVQDAMYARLKPGLDTSRREAENRLLNSGIEKGTQAWNDAQQNLSRGETDAQMQSILAGSQEQSRLAGLDQASRAQQFSEQGTQFQQGLAAAQFGGQQRQQQVAEEAYLRQLPLNELNALRSGSQVQAPSFSGYYTGGQAGAVDTAGISRDAYGNIVDANNASNANKAATNSAVATVAAAALMSY
jgi:hypothetical protein